MAELFQKYGYFLNRTKEEIDRVVDTRTKTMFSHFRQVAEDYAGSAREVLHSVEPIDGNDVDELLGKRRARSGH